MKSRSLPLVALALVLASRAAAAESAAGPSAPAPGGASENKTSAGNDNSVSAPVTNNLTLNNPAAFLAGEGGGSPGPLDQLQVDPDKGTMNWKGRTFDLGNSRAFRARFERYLNLLPSDQQAVAAYQAKLKNISKLVSPLLQNPDSLDETHLKQAYELLYEAAEYKGDAGASSSLAHMLFNTWRLRGEIRQMNLERERINNRFDREQREARPSGADNASSAGGKAASSTNTALQKATLDASAPAAVLLAKAQFQTQIAYFVAQRRFEHAVLGVAFYRLLFKAQAQGFEASKEILGGLLPKGDVPTGEFIERLCREAMNDVDGTLQVVRSAVAAGDLDNATERLQETFHLGEFLEPVTTLPAEERLAIRDYYRLKRDLPKFQENRDWARLLELNQRLAEAAKDYRGGELVALAEGNMQASNLALASAKMEMGRNNFPEAQRFIREATSLWPLNPELKTLASNVSSQADASVGLTGRFDEALKAGDLRGLFNQRHEMGLALMRDAARSEKLKAALDQVGQAELLLAQVRKLAEQSNLNAAWELLLQAEKLLPQDREVLGEKSRLLVGAGPFARSLDEAARAEGAKHWASALSLYQQALDASPASVLAREGRARAAAALLAAGRADAASIP